MAQADSEAQADYPKGAAPPRQEEMAQAESFTQGS